MAIVLFLEPAQETSPYTSLTERMIDALIRTFSQKPTLVHSELVMLPFSKETIRSKKISFATYLGSHADYQSQTNDCSGVDFYLIQNGSRWRALPVIAGGIISKMQSACDANVGAPYSLLMYPTSSHYFRNLSWIWGDKARHKGHCATLAARVLRSANVDCGVRHASPWYSPSSLYAALHDSLASSVDRTASESLHCEEKREETEASIETMLRGPLSARTYYDLGHSKCVSAIRELAYRVVSSAHRDDPFDKRVECEKELAEAVLRYTLVGVHATTDES